MLASASSASSVYYDKIEIKLSSEIILKIAGDDTNELQDDIENKIKQLNQDVKKVEIQRGDGFIRLTFSVLIDGYTLSPILEMQKNDLYKISMDYTRIETVGKMKNADKNIKNIQSQYENNILKLAVVYKFPEEMRGRNMAVTTEPIEEKKAEPAPISPEPKIVSEKLDNGMSLKIKSKDVISYEIEIEPALKEKIEIEKPTPEPKVETPEVKVDKIEPKVEVPEQKIATPEPKVENIPESKIEKIETRVETPEVKVEPSAPKVEVVEPKEVKPEPKIEESKPKEVTPEPKTQEIKPKVEIIEPKVQEPERKVGKSQGVSNTVLAHKIDEEKNAPSIDGLDNDSIWGKISPEEIKLVREDGQKITVSVKAAYFSDTIFILASWADSTKNNTHETLTWSKNKKEYTMGKDIEDSVALLFYMGDVKNSCMTSSTGTTADYWRWCAARSDKSQYAFDGMIKTSASKLAHANSYKGEGGKKIWIQKLQDSGVAPWKIQLPVKFIGDKIPSYLPETPTISSADVRARGGYVKDRWVVEFSRELNTNHSDDIVFDTAKKFLFAIAVYNGAMGRDHFSSQLIELTFEK